MFVDIHSHMLPDVDDGAQKISVTREMIELAYQQGCRRIIFTPHADAYDYADDVKDKYEIVKEWVAETFDDMKVYLGGEIYISTEGYKKIDSIIDKINNGIYPTLNGTKYVLIEFNLGGFVYKDMLPVVNSLFHAGYIPVIAHVERYGNPMEDIQKLKDRGCVIQMNIGNVFNPRKMNTMFIADQLLRNKIIDLVGTDAHGMIWRPPMWEPYTDSLYERYDKEYVDGILSKNAVKMLELE